MTDKTISLELLGAQVLTPTDGTLLNMLDQGVPLDQLRELLCGVDPEQLRQVMPLVGGVITMMFTDIVDSTRVKHEVGDPTYFAALNRHNNAVRKCIALHAGHELKMIGDSFFVAFTDPSKAVQCAAEIQQTLAETPILVGDGSISVRIGLHTGTPIVYRDDASRRTDLSGTDVDKAARVESIARGRQVLISEQTRVFADRMAIRDWGIWELKGLGGQRIFEVLYSGKHPEVPAGRMRLEPLRFATSFIGREREVAELAEALKHYRLVTVTGMGGIGKTRLADFAARRVSDTFADGAFFVELARTADSESAVVSELVAALAVNPAGIKDEAEALRNALQNRQVLIVLDNFEGVTSATPLLSKLFLGCPHAHFLVTSQTPLNLDGEQLYQAPAMGIPAGAAGASELGGLDAFALFRERACARVHDWGLRSPAEITAIAEILRLVDGIPLAIELAAAWIGSKTLQEIRTGLDNRLDLLKRRGFGATSRHQSMQACLDNSFGLLSDDAREFLPKLATFAGGFFVEDVEAVCGISDVGELLVSLHERGLLVRQEVLGRSRYSMLATVQEYAADKLPETVAGELKRAHTRYFREVLRAADQQLGEAGYIAALERIAIDFANFEAGIRESQNDGDHAAALDYAALLADYLRIKGRSNDRLSMMLAARAAAEKLGPEATAGADNNLGIAYAGLPTGDRGDNLRRAIACYEAALRVWTEGDFPQHCAMTQNNLGTAYANLPTGDRGDNLRRAIACYEAALRVRTEGDFPQDWATTQNNLGAAYAGLPTGDRGNNLRRAIAYYEAALRVRTEGDFPQDWAMTHNNLGTAYANLPTGDRGDNLRHAIACYKAALRVWTERDFPQDWATTQNNLGAAHVGMPTGDRGDNLRHAIACYEAALRVRTERDFPQDWATTQTNLGAVYASLPTGDRGDNLRRAIACFETALRVRTERDFPQDWATTQINLGAAYGNLPTGDRGDNLRRAIACYEAALRVWTERDFPQDWATTQNNLGGAYTHLLTGDRGDNLRHAIACYEAALRVRNELDFPQDWATIQNNLGIAYRNLPTGDSSENLTHAITCFEAALRVRTERDFPQDWATTQNNLGIAYRNLPTGDSSENLTHAITCFEAALRVRTERDFPQDWATTQNNLGIAYRNLPTGDSSENSRRAIGCYEAALRVWTERDFPQNWATTQINLGAANAGLPTDDRGDNLRRGIACYEAALRVCTERDFPQHWAGTQNNLGVAYAGLPTGDRGDNLGRAIACYEAALRVRNELDFPQDWASTQDNLGAAYAELATGDRGDNLQRAVECYEAAARGYDATGLTNEAGRARTMAEQLRKGLT